LLQLGQEHRRQRGAFPARPDRLRAGAGGDPRRLLGVCHGDVGSFRGGSLIVREPVVGRLGCSRLRSRAPSAPESSVETSIRRSHDPLEGGGVGADIHERNRSTHPRQQWDALTCSRVYSKFCH
jgi:hypothetical protein